jgi:hypothetical protein
MTTDLREKLEQLDTSIDHLERVASDVARSRPSPGGVARNGTRNRTEVLSRLDTVIERLESFLAH